MHAAPIEDRIDIFAEAMRAQFGSRAAQIALDQSRHADGLVREVWLSVLHRIDQRYLPEKASDAPFARPSLNTIPPVVL